MGNVTKEMFDKGKNLAYSIFQKDSALFDPDINDARQILFWLIRDLGYLLQLDGFKDNGFKVIPSSPLENNFALTAGYGMHEGKRLYLAENAPLLPVTDTQSNMNLCFVISDFTATSLTDFRRNMVVDAYKGNTLFVHREGHIPRQYTIAGNTSNTFSFSGTDLVGDGVTDGDYYTVRPSTPTVDRYDAVLLNIFLDEVDSDEDPDLRHNIGGQFVNELRQKIRYCVEVIEDIGDPSTYSVPSSYTDYLGNSHSYKLIATIHRSSGDADINIGDITDQRTEMTDLTDFILNSGDTFEGDYNVGISTFDGDSGNIDFDEGSLKFIRWIQSPQFDLMDSTVTERIKLVVESSEIYKPSFYRAVLRTLPDNNLARLFVAEPLENSDAASKGYVDGEIEGHYHEQYLVESSLGRTYLDDLTSVVGGATFVNTDSHTWSHNLGDEFIIVQVQQKNGSGYWENAAGNGTNGVNWEIVDENTLQFTNNSGGDIASANLRVVVFKVHDLSAIYPNDIIDTDIEESYNITRI